MMNVIFKFRVKFSILLRVVIYVSSMILAINTNY